jgi:bis(5'-adenosyl)-triphosphatase
VFLLTFFDDHTTVALTMGIYRLLVSFFLLIQILQPTASLISTSKPAVSCQALSASINKEDTMDSSMLFGRFKIPSSHVFLQTKLSFGFVNLRPIVPGHVLISPHRVVPRMADLSDDEYSDLWTSVRKTQTVLTERYGPSSFNIAVQDGAASGQSVPHVHVHILPRFEGDFERNDDVYDELQDWAPRKEMVDSKAKLDVPEDENRKDRTSEQMAEEATAYKTLF